MSTPIEDRVTALETRRTEVDLLLDAAEADLKRLTEQNSEQARQIHVLETAYTDAVGRFQKAERLVSRLRVILRILWLSTATERASYLALRPKEERAQFAVDLEEILSLERITRRGDPDEWREPRTRG